MATPEGYFKRSLYSMDRNCLKSILRHFSGFFQVYQIDIAGEGSTQEMLIQRLDVPLLYKPDIIASEHFPKVRFSKPRVLLALAATVSTCVFQGRMIV